VLYFLFQGATPESTTPDPKPDIRKDMLSSRKNLKVMNPASLRRDPKTENQTTKTENRNPEN